MRTQDVIWQICEEMRQSETPPNLANTVTRVLQRAGFNLRIEPSLEDMKRILVAVSQAINEPPQTVC